jgi:hypothetical protein
MINDFDFKYKYYLHVPIGMIKKYGLKAALFYMELRSIPSKGINNYKYYAFEKSVFGLSKKSQQQLLLRLKKNGLISYHYIDYKKMKKKYLIYWLFEGEFLKYEKDKMLKFLIVDCDDFFRWFNTKCCFWYILQSFENQYIEKKRKGNFDFLTESITISVKKSFLINTFSISYSLLIKLKKMSIINDYNGFQNDIKDYIFIKANPNIVDIFNCPEKSLFIS